MTAPEYAPTELTEQDIITSIQNEHTASDPAAKRLIRAQLLQRLLGDEASDEPPKIYEQAAEDPTSVEIAVRINKALELHESHPSLELLDETYEHLDVEDMEHLNQIQRAAAVLLQHRAEVSI